MAYELLLAGLCGTRSWCCRKAKPPGVWGLGSVRLPRARAALCSKPHQAMGEEQCVLLKKHQAKKIKIKSKPTAKAAAVHWRSNAPRTGSLSLLAAAQSSLFRGWADLAVNIQVFHSREVLSGFPLCPLCSWWFDLQPKATEALSEDRGVSPSYFKCGLPTL